MNSQECYLCYFGNYLSILVFSPHLPIPIVQRNEHVREYIFSGNQGGKKSENASLGEYQRHISCQILRCTISIWSVSLRDLDNINFAHFFCVRCRFTVCVTCPVHFRLNSPETYPTPLLSCPILHTSLPNFLVEAVILRRLRNDIERRWMAIDIIRAQSS